METNAVAKNQCASFGNANGQLVCEGGEALAEVKAQLLDNEEGVPPGPYLESCGGCKVEERGELTCSGCINWQGATQASTLVLESCVGDTIGNKNGRLVCETPPLPKGKYKSTCRNCSLRKGQDPNAVYYLACRCNDGQENLKDATLYPPPGESDFGPCQSIDNQNGELVCDTGGTREKDASGLPPGSYEESCRE